MAASTIDHANCPMAREDPTDGVARLLASKRQMRVVEAARSEEGGRTDMRSPVRERTAGWNGIWERHVTLDVTDSATRRKRSNAWTGDSWQMTMKTAGRMAASPCCL